MEGGKEELGPGAWVDRFSWYYNYTRILSIVFLEWISPNSNFLYMNPAVYQYLRMEYLPARVTKKI